jgi:tetratricopeptide (TPR) repeat protein
MVVSDQSSRIVVQSAGARLNAIAHSRVAFRAEGRESGDGAKVGNALVGRHFRRSPTQRSALCLYAVTAIINRTVGTPVGIIMHKRFLFAATIAATVAAIAVAFGARCEAQTREQIDACDGKGNYAADAAVGGCTAMIQSGKYSGRNLAIAFNNRCSAYYRKKDYDTAIKDCDQAIRLDPKYALAFYNRGLIYYSKDDYDRAIGDSAESIRLNPSYANAYDTRGNAYSDQGNHDRALRDYNDSIRLNPKNPITLANRCDENGILKNWIAARSDCDESLRIRPNHVNTLLHRALVLLALGKLEESAADYGNVLQQRPKDAEALFGRGTIRLKRGDTAGGEEDIAAAKAVRASVVNMLSRYGVTADDK